jgi:mRNA interferase RelE/StbE
MHSIIIKRSALKALSKLPEKEAIKISEAIDKLADNARPDGCKKLEGRKDDSYRIRVGNYRVIYEINDGELKIMVVEIGNRKEIYKKK